MTTEGFADDKEESIESSEKVSQDPKEADEVMEASKNEEKVVNKEETEPVVESGNSAPNGPCIDETICNQVKNDNNDTTQEEKEGQENEDGVEEIEEDDCELDPNFAVICSFFLKFGDSLGITYSIEDLKTMLEDHTHIHEELIELHIKLLRKRRKYINREKWEKSLVKFAAEYDAVHSWELERFGYQYVRTSIRLELLKRLLEAQFDFNSKFKGEVNSLEAASLRLLPIGRDIKGNQFWYQLDTDANIRIYREMSDEDKSWTLVCKDKEELMSLVEQLKSQTTLEPVKSGGSSGNVSSSDDEEEEAVTSDQEGVKQEEVTEEVLKEDDKKVANGEVEITIKKEEEDSKPEAISEEPSTDILNKVEEKKPSSDKSDSQVIPVKVEEQEESESRSDTKLSSSIDQSLLKEETIDSQTDNDIQSQSTNVYIESTQEQPEEDGAIVRLILNSIISQVEQAIFEEVNCNQRKTSCRGRSGSRGRGRGRGRWRGRGSAANTGSRDPSKSTEKSVKTSAAPSASRSSSRRCLSRELMELNGLAEQEILKEQEQEDSSAPRLRQSRRIQQLQEKKMAELAARMKAEQERIEVAAKRKAEMLQERERKRKAYEENIANGKSKKVQSDSSYEESDNDSSDEDFKHKSKGRKGRKRRRKGKGRKNCPWMDSSDSDGNPDHDSEMEEEIEEDDDDILKFDDNADDEFACEDPEPESEPVVLRRARTAKKVKSVYSGEESEEETDDTVCKRCTKGDHPEWILLCDRCDAGFHISCLLPPLMIIPDSDWFCPPCENAMLIERLETELEVITQLLDKKEKEELQKKRLKYVTVNESNIIPDEESERRNGVVNGDDDEEGTIGTKNPSRKSRQKRFLNSEDEEEEELSDEEDEDTEDSESDSGSEDDTGFNLRARRRKNISYQFKEYDDLIKSAIRASDEEYYEEEGVGEGADEEENSQQPSIHQSRGKDMATIEHAVREEEAKEAAAAAAAGENIPQATGDNLDGEETNPVIENVKPGEAPVTATADETQQQPKQPLAKGRKALAKRKPVKRRKLNDLDSPVEESDDSDEDFKGDSATELEDLSDEFKVSEDEDATEEENDSDDSELMEYRRRSARSSRVTRNSRKGRKGKKGKRGGRYHRDDFVVDSDEEYGGAHRPRTRGKRKTYREISSDETEEEEEWVSDSPKPKKRGRKADSESSDEEWGVKKTDKRKKRKSWGADDDDDSDLEQATEEEEEPTEEESKSEEDSVESDDSEAIARAKAKKIVRKTAPPIQKPMVKKSGKKGRKAKKSPKAPKIEMRGKPRLSRLRVTNLREKNEDEEEEEAQEEKEIQEQETEEAVIEEGKTEQLLREEPKVEEGSPPNLTTSAQPFAESKVTESDPFHPQDIGSNLPPPLGKAPKKPRAPRKKKSNDHSSKDAGVAAATPARKRRRKSLSAEESVGNPSAEQTPSSDSSAPVSQGSLKSRPSLESPLIAAALTNPQKHSPYPQPLSQQLPPHLQSQRPSQSEGPSALSALTAFASRGPTGHPQESPPQPPNHHVRGPVPHPFTPYGLPPHYPHGPPSPPANVGKGIGPPPNVHSFPPHGPAALPPSTSGDYTITSLDSYPQKAPLKPNETSSYSPPSSSSPPKILNLDSQQRYEGYRPTGPRGDPKQQPPVYPGSGYPPPSSGYPGHRYPPPALGPPHGYQIDPSHAMYRHGGPPSHSRSPYGPPPGAPPSHGGPPPPQTSPYFRGHSPHDPVTPPHPGYPYGPPPRHAPPSYPGHSHVPTPPHHPYGHPYGPPPPPPGLHPSQYAAYYAAMGAGGGTPNGGFMIQNLLPPPTTSTPSTSSGPSAVTTSSGGHSQPYAARS